MSDHRFSLDAKLTIYGQSFEWHPWLNWNPNGDQAVDQRIIDWFADCYAKARAKWDAENPPASAPVCPGFQWIGQSFEHCDGCGEPYWEHEYDQRIKRDKGPFDDDLWDYVPISAESKTKVKARYVTT